MPEPAELQNLIQKIISDRYTRAELEHFLHICRSLALAFLQCQQYKQHFYLRIEAEDGRMLQDFALDLIAPLFERDGFGSFVQFKTYFRKYRRALEADPRNAGWLLRSLVVQKVRQQLFVFFSREEPEAWRICRNIRLAPLRNPAIGVFRDSGIIYYYYDDGKIEVVPEDLQPQQPEVNIELLKNWLVTSEGAYPSTPARVEFLLRRVAQNLEFRRFVSRSLFYHVMKELYTDSMIPLEDAWLPGEAGVEVRPEPVELFGERLLDQLGEMIEQKYLARGKVTLAESRCYRAILCEYFCDLLNDGFADPLPVYIRLHGCGEMLVARQRVHRNRLEYLIKSGKQILRDLLELHQYFPKTN